VSLCCILVRAQLTLGPQWQNLQDHISWNNYALHGTCSSCGTPPCPGRLPVQGASRTWTITDLSVHVGDGGHLSNTCQSPMMMPQTPWPCRVLQVKCQDTFRRVVPLLTLGMHPRGLQRGSWYFACAGVCLSTTLVHLCSNCGMNGFTTVSFRSFYWWQKLLKLFKKANGNRFKCYLEYESVLDCKLLFLSLLTVTQCLSQKFSV